VADTPPNRLLEPQPNRLDRPVNLQSCVVLIGVAALRNRHQTRGAPLFFFDVAPDSTFTPEARVGPHNGSNAGQTVPEPLPYQAPEGAAERRFMVGSWGVPYRLVS
jgi:hypothetical protein